MLIGWDFRVSEIFRDRAVTSLAVMIDSGDPSMLVQSQGFRLSLQGSIPVIMEERLGPTTFMPQRCSVEYSQNTLYYSNPGIVKS